VSGGQKKGPSLIPKTAADKSQNKYINKNAAFIHSYLEPGDEATVFISLRLLQNDFQCFSEWTKNEMDIFWEFNRDIHHLKWKELKQQGGKGQNKAGYAPTPISIAQYNKPAFTSTLDPNTTFIELRVSSKIRVHGFRDKSVFYICYLDRNHQICA